jgi:hypothetical protein
MTWRNEGYQLSCLFRGSGIRLDNPSNSDRQEFRVP